MQKSETNNFAKLLTQYGMDNFDKMIADKEIGEQDIVSRKNNKITKTQSIQATIDLHSQSREEAVRNIENFIENCHNKKLTKVLIITGKGTGIIREETKKILEEMIKDKKIKQYYYKKQPFRGSQTIRH